MPEEPDWFPKSEILSFEEIERLVRVAAAGGVRKLRITGGEPLVRRELPRLIARLTAVPGIDDVSLTTNGVLLAPLARDLAAAGLRRINVSLDSLDPARFVELTGRDRLADVLRGLDAAAAAGLAPIKLNAVLLAGINDDEAVALAGFGRERVITGDSVRRRISAVWPILPDPAADPHAPAARWRYADGSGSVGFIDSVTAPFCGTCGRIRLTSDGKLRVCLYDDREVDLKRLLRAGAPDAEIAAAIEGAVRRKGRGGALDILESRRAIPLVRTMHQIGG